jgi:hypothetical protein
MKQLTTYGSPRASLHLSIARTLIYLSVCLRGTTKALEKKEEEEKKKNEKKSEA